MAGRHVEWVVIPGHPHYEINRLGDIRDTKNGRKMDPAFTARFYYGLDPSRDRNRVQRETIRTAFPDIPEVTYKRQRITY